MITQKEMKTSKKTTQKSTPKSSLRTTLKSAAHIKNIAIVYRPNKPQASSLASEVCTWLKEQGVKVFCMASQSLSGAAKIKDVTKIDLFVVLGGDGTYLKAVRLIDGRDIPVLGFNLGSLGFLTESRTTEIYQTLEKAITGRLKSQTRTMLEVTIKKRGKKPATFLALNDIVIERGPISRLISLGIYSDNHLVSEMKADGLIVCTPTGSTAYNLASSGPIVHPEVRAMVITPICPHSLTNRPITLPDHQVVTIKVAQSTQKAVFMVDGQKCADIRDEDEVVVKKSEFLHTRLISPNTSYFDILRTKLKFGQRD